MIITKKEAMKAVIDGTPTQDRFSTGCTQGLWIDSFSPTYTLIEKIISINASTGCEFRLKPEVKKISYQCFLYKIFDGTVGVSVWTHEDMGRQKELEQSSDFVKWVGDTVTVEIGE